MGAICNNVQESSLGSLEIVQDTSTKAYYEPVVLDETSYLQSRISDLLKNDESTVVFNLEFHSFG
jgi:hypothetical protein